MHKGMPNAAAAATRLEAAFVMQSLSLPVVGPARVTGATRPLNSPTRAREVAERKRRERQREPGDVERIPQRAEVAFQAVSLDLRRLANCKSRDHVITRHQMHGHPRGSVVSTKHASVSGKLKAVSSQQSVVCSQ
jgi:hypothetical protein